MTQRYTKMMQNSNISSFYPLFALQVICRQSRHCKRHFSQVLCEISQRWLEPSSRTAVGKVSPWSPLLHCSHVPNCFLAWSEAVLVQFFSVQYLSSCKDPCPVVIFVHSIACFTRLNQIDLRIRRDPGFRWNRRAQRNCDWQPCKSWRSRSDRRRSNHRVKPPTFVRRRSIARALISCGKPSQPRSKSGHEYVRLFACGRGKGGERQG